MEPLTDTHSFGDMFEPDENFFEDGLTKTQSVTSLDTTLSYSEWSRPAKLSQAACRLLKVGGDRVSAEGWTGVRRQCAI